MTPGPLARIRRGEPSPPVERQPKPQAVSLVARGKPMRAEPPTEPRPKKEKPPQMTKTERNKLRSDRRKAKKAEQRALGLLPPPSQHGPPLMDAPRPQDRNEALTWIGTRMARQIVRTPNGPYVKPAPLPGQPEHSSPDQLRIATANEWLKTFSVCEETVTIWSNRTFWRCYEATLWIHQNFAKTEKLWAMQQITAAFEAELLKLRA